MSAEGPRPSGCSALLRVFNRMALQGFGGVLPVAQYHLVERERWLSREEFLGLLAAGQALPGPNVVNLALMVGDRFFGLRGALAALLGLLALPTALVLLLAALYARHDEIPAVAGALRGMGAVSAGLVVATGLKLLPVLRKGPLGLATGLVFVGLTLGAVLALHWHLAAVLVAVGGTAVALAWWRLR